MAITNNNLVVIDLPSWELMQTTAAASAAGVVMCNDRRGTSRFIYALISATSFWRYDVYANTWQQLASPPGGTLGAGTDIMFDPSSGTTGYVWAIISSGTGAPTFQYYDCAANAWTARSVTNLGATMGTDSALTHTCSTYNASGDDDLIYLIGNASTVLYRFSITGNSWVNNLTVQPSACGAGCGFRWMPTVDVDRLYRIRGENTATVDYYSIAGNSWTALVFYPLTETFNTGSQNASRAMNTDKILLEHNITYRIHELDISAGTLTPVATEYLVAGGATHVGNRFCYVVEPNGIEFIYYWLCTSSYMLRTPLFF
jgi:hypothetical protein